MAKQPQLQLGLFEPAVGTSSTTKGQGFESSQPEPRTRVRLATKAAQIPLREKRREALGKLLDILKQLEGHDIFVGTYGGAHSHFWLSNLKLGRLRVENLLGEDKMPAVIVLWGNRGASIRVFTDQMVAVREQQYQGYTLWLVDFWNGFGEYPLDPYRPKGFVSLDIVHFKD